MSEIFDEVNMRRTLEKFIPAGETLAAGIHGISHETEIVGVFGKCVCAEGRLIPDENGGVIRVSKKKYSSYDVYIGITQHFLVIAECERCSYLYEFEDGPDVRGEEIWEVASPLFFQHIGTCYPLSDIVRCEFKKGWMGSVKCCLAMKNKSHFKLMFPKLGGLGKGMPHHGEYRQAIIARLGEFG